MADKDDDTPVDIWLNEEDRWELTWPIWHMLPRQERKALAHKHGFEKIGDFEEWMSLQQAEKDTKETRRYPNNLVIPGHEHRDHEVTEEKKGEDDDAGSVASDHGELEEKMEKERVEATDRMSTKELLELGGQILILSDDMLHRCFSYLPVDAYATLALVSPHWKSFTRTETVYKRLCERLYLHQSKKRQLHVSKFGNSFRQMLLSRPRVRANGGVYVMKYSRVKPIQRDMWTEVPIGAILETTYYRYLYFQEDGRVLYSLTTAPPHEMFRRILKILLYKTSDDAVVWGTYQVAKRQVVVQAVQSWQHVKLEMTIQPNSMHGRYGYLSFDKHQTSSTGKFEGDDVLNFEVPGEPFRFVRDKRL